MVECRGDWKWLYELFDLKRNYKRIDLCHFCKASRKSGSQNQLLGLIFFSIYNASSILSGLGALNIYIYIVFFLKWIAGAGPTVFPRDVGYPNGLISTVRKYLHNLVLFRPTKLTRFTQFRSMESFHRYSVPEFYLRVLGNYVNPLCSVVGWNPFMIRFCAMHCVNLGIVQWLNGCTLHTLFDDFDMFSNGYFVLIFVHFFSPFQSTF